MLTEAINRGHISHFLAKPFDHAHLRELVKKVLLEIPEIPEKAVVLASDKISITLESALRSAGFRFADQQEADNGDILLWKAPITSKLLDRIRRALFAEDEALKNRNQLGMFELIGKSLVASKQLQRFWIG